MAKASPPFLSIHQYNPNPGQAHEDFLRFVATLNEAVAKTGLAPTRYLVWKVIGRQQGDYGFVLGSLWPNRELYDAVHAHEAFAAAIEKCKELGLDPFESELTNQYALLNPPAGGPPTGFEDRVRHLAMDAQAVGSLADENALVEILAKGSEAIARAGHPETRYDLWRVADKPNGPYRHLFGSLWASREAYDDVHAHAAHRTFMEKYGKELKALLGDGYGNRYDRIPTP